MVLSKTGKDARHSSRVNGSLLGDLSKLSDLDLEGVALLEAVDGVEVDGALVAEVVEQVVGALGLFPPLLVPKNLWSFKSKVH